MTTYSDRTDALDTDSPYSDEETRAYRTDSAEQPLAFEPPVASNDYPAEELQRQRFGGINWGAGFFGWLVVVAMTTLLAGASAAAAFALGLAPRSVDAETADPTMLLTAAAVALLVVVLAHFCGGYVAGRMSRFDGGRQGLAVWVVELLLTGGVAGLVLLLGPEVDVPTRLDLPAAGLSGAPTGLTALAAAVVVLLVGLLAAVVGGKAGCRYHRKVDDAAYV